MPAGSIKAIIAALLVALGLGGAPTPPDRLGLPALMLWSLDRADDLRFIDPADTGVAYLAGSIRVGAEGIGAVPRRNPLLSGFLHAAGVVRTARFCLGERSPRGRG